MIWVGVVFPDIFNQDVEEAFELVRREYRMVSATCCGVGLPGLHGRTTYLVAFFWLARLEEVSVLRCLLQDMNPRTLFFCSCTAGSTDHEVSTSAMLLRQVDFDVFKCLSSKVFCVVNAH